MLRHVKLEHDNTWKTSSTDDISDVMSDLTLRLADASTNATFGWAVTVLLDGGVITIALREKPLLP